MKDRPMMMKAVVALFFLGTTATIAQAIDMIWLRASLLPPGSASAPGV
jgi:hypothetical protein